MRSMPYEQYFGEMDLTERQIRERLLFALKFENAVLVAISRTELIHKYDEINNLTRENIVADLAQMYEELFLEFADLDEEMYAYFLEFAESVVETTLKNIDDEYFTSYDRAMLIAENEANTSLNHADYKRAIKEGFTQKTWKTMEDPAVRQTHKDVENETIPIEEYFLVGDSLMRYPKDLNGINVQQREIVNCRCSIKYS